MVLVDSHCHLNLLNINDEELFATVKRAQDNHVHYLLNVSVNTRDFAALLETSNKFDNVWASLGLHPNDTDEEVSLEKLLELGKSTKVIAIGETGLDYYRVQGDVVWQQTRFRTHIAAAKELQLPLIIHTRLAKEDTVTIMKEAFASTIGGVMHCFTEDWEMAKACLDLGFYISFSGIVTFKNATEVQTVAKKMPLDRMLIETDSPYLAPNPYRGKKNEPSYVLHTAEFLANLKGITLETLADQTTQNFFKLFNKAEAKHV